MGRFTCKCWRVKHAKLIFNASILTISGLAFVVVVAGRKCKCLCWMRWNTATEKHLSLLFVVVVVSKSFSLTHVMEAHKPDGLGKKWQAACHSRSRLILFQPVIPRTLKTAKPSTLTMLFISPDCIQSTEHRASGRFKTPSRRPLQVILPSTPPGMFFRSRHRLGLKLSTRAAHVRRKHN